MSFYVGETVVIIARLYNPRTYDPAEAESVKITIYKNGAALINEESMTLTDEGYIYYYDAPSTGSYSYTITAQNEQQTAKEKGMFKIQ
jgi:hypothetical protein